MLYIETPPRDENRAKKAYNAAIILLLLAFFTSSIITFIGTVICLAVLGKSFEFWLKCKIMIWIFYILSLGLTLISATIMLILVITFAFTAYKLEDFNIKLSTTSGVVIFSIEFILFCAELAYIVKVFRPVIDLYPESQSEPLITPQPIENKKESKIESGYIPVSVK